MYNRTNFVSFVWDFLPRIEELHRIGSRVCPCRSLRTICGQKRIKLNLPVVQRAIFGGHELEFHFGEVDQVPEIGQRENCKSELITEEILQKVINFPNAFLTGSVWYGRISLNGSFWAFRLPTCSFLGIGAVDDSSPDSAGFSLH